MKLKDNLEYKLTDNIKIEGFDGGYYDLSNLENNKQSTYSLVISDKRKKNESFSIEGIDLQLLDVVPGYPVNIITNLYLIKVWIKDDKVKNINVNLNKD